MKLKLFLTMITCITVSFSLDATKFNIEQLNRALEYSADLIKKEKSQDLASISQNSIAWVKRHFKENQIEWTEESGQFFDARIEMFVPIEWLPYINQLLAMGALDEQGTTALSLAKKMKNKGWIKALEMLALKNSIK